MTSDATPLPPAVAVLAECFERVRDELPAVLEGLTAEELLWQPDPSANSIGWLVWHLARVQDDHLAGVARGLGRPVDQVWADWEGRYGLPYESADIGYGHSAQDVAAFDVGDSGLLLGYLAAVHERTAEVLGQVRDEELATVVDTYDGEPITAQVRLVSVVGDITQHQGQAAYLRGLLERRR